MKIIPDEVSKAWDNRKGPAIFTTIDKEGVPNSIYTTCISKYGEGTIVIADNYFNKTKRNIFSGSSGAILFLTSEDKSYQIKGSIKYYSEGEVFDDMKKWNPKKHPGHGAAALEAEEIYKGSEKII